MCSENHDETKLNQLITNSIKCVMKVYEEDEFLLWAVRWINGEDRSDSSAMEAEEAAALDWQEAETLSPEWRAAKSAWEVVWAARLSVMDTKHRARAKAAATRAVAWAEEIE